MSFSDFVDAVLRVADKRLTHSLGKVQNEAAILTATQQDVTGYERVIDNYGLRHAFKSHSDSRKEAQRGQVAITHADLKNIDLVLKQPDTIFHGGLTSTNLHVAVSSKKIGDHTLFVSEEIRPGRKQIVQISMWKRVAAAT